MEFNRENIRQEQLINAKLYSTRYEYAKENIVSNTVALEVGTLAGDYADFLISECNINDISLVDKFDQYDWEVPGYTKRFTPETHYDFVVNRFINKNVTIHKGLSQDVLLLIDKTFDYIYLDDNHSERHVRNMLHISKDLLNPGGVIGINDYTKYGIIRKEDYGTMPYEEVCYGVIPAVNNFLLDNPSWTVKAFSFNDTMFSDIYIQKPKHP